LPTEELLKLPFSVPSIVEQRAIVAFVRRETERVDRLISEQERLIALLQEKRQAVISHAVTKGMDPNAPTKESGIDWIGAIPEHWSLVPLKYLVSIRGGNTPSKDRLEYWDGDVPWASAKDLKVDVLSDTEDHLTNVAISDGAASLVPADSILVVVRGMILARTFPVTRCGVPMAINQDLKALTASRDLETSFLFWLLRGSTDESTRRCEEAGHGTKALRMEKWLSMPLPVPPREEQLAIANWVSSAMNDNGRLILAAERSVELLRERRTALITAAVTGQIDVRGLVETAA
jgi:type I restriction enzyme S subunit